MTTQRWPGPLPDHGRFDYRPITRRPDHTWPGGARLAVYLGFNIEHFAFGDGLGASIGAPSPQPDVLNHSWREYGNRTTDGQPRHYGGAVLDAPQAARYRTRAAVFAGSGWDPQP